MPEIHPQAVANPRFLDEVAAVLERSPAERRDVRRLPLSGPRLRERLPPRHHPTTRPAPHHLQATGTAWASGRT